MIDIHNHILYGVDDGAKDFEQSLQLLLIAKEQGITHIICTPHLHPDRYSHSLDEIQHKFTHFVARKEVKETGMQLSVSAEVRLTEALPKQIDNNQIPFIGRWENYNCILLELPHSHIPAGTDKLLAWLERRRIRAIIPHPERNKQIMRDPGQVQALVRNGALFQLTAGSLLGTFGPQAQEVANWFVQRDLARFVASDAHNPGHRPPLLKPAAQYIEKRYGPALSLNLTVAWPYLLTTSLIIYGHDVR